MKNLTIKVGDLKKICELYKDDDIIKKLLTEIPSSVNYSVCYSYKFKRSFPFFRREYSVKQILDKYIKTELTFESHIMLKNILYDCNFEITEEIYDMIIVYILKEKDKYLFNIIKINQ